MNACIQSLQMVTCAPIKASIMSRTYNVIFQHIAAQRLFNGKNWDHNLDSAIWDTIMNMPKEDLLKIKGFGIKCWECVLAIREYYEPSTCDVFNNPGLGPWKSKVQDFVSLCKEGYTECPQ